MAIAANNRQLYTTTVAALTHALSYTVGSGASLLVVKVTAEPPLGEVIAEVRWGGSGGTLLTQAVTAKTGGTTDRQAEIFYLINPTPATQDVWVSLGVNSRVIAFEVVWFSGTDTTSPIADTAINAPASSLTTIQTSDALVPVGTANWLEVVLCGGNQLLTHTPQGSMTESNDAQAGQSHRSVHGWQSGISANVQPGFDVDAAGSHVMAIAAVLIKPSAVGPVYTQTKFQVYLDDGTSLGPPPLANFDEEWTGANGATWNGTRWTTAKAGASATIDIQSNRGRIQPNATDDWVRALASSPAYANFDLIADFTPGATGSGQFHWLTFRHGGSWSGAEPFRPQNGYQVAIWNDGSNHFSLESIVAGTTSTLSSPDNKTWGTGTWNLRVRAVGTSLKVRAWQGATEPTTWDIEVTNSNHASGVIALSSVTGDNQPINWDNLHAASI